MKEDLKQLVALIRIDSSENSKAAMSWYLKWLHKPDDALGIIHVYMIPNTPSCYSGGLLPSITEIMNENAALIEEYKDILASHGIEDAVFFNEIVDDSIGHTIFKVAKKNNPSLIVMGQRGVGTIRRTILGSVTDYVLHHAEQPTLVIPSII